jgi:hypothetical protein
MSVRFVIRRIWLDGQRRWSIRDGICRNAETHDFNSPYWAEDCEGACDTSTYFGSVIAVADAFATQGT